MSEIHDLKKYKESLALLPHLDTILKVFNLTEAALKHYGTYIPVAKVLMTIRDQKALIELYKVNYKKIKEAKGKKV